ncbi:MAG: HypC/HybG/HupF family hydrogenase formation chaperone [Pseudomonadota bacterium]
MVGGRGAQAVLECPESDQTRISLEISSYRVRCAARGSERTVSLWLLQEDDLAVGDYVMVQLDHAVRKVSTDEAQLAWVLCDEILAFLTAAARPLPD